MLTQIELLQPYYIVAVHKNIRSNPIEKVILYRFVPNHSSTHLPHVQPALVYLTIHHVLLLFQSEVEVLVGQMRRWRTVVAVGVEQGGFA